MRFYYWARARPAPRSPVFYLGDDTVRGWYKSVHLDCGYRLDFLIENQIILELKSVETLQGIHEAQLLTYLKLAKKQHGLLINFNVKLLKQGIKSFVL